MAGPSHNQLEEFRAFADALADAARAEILPFFRTDLAVENKKTDSFDPVTAADKAAEATMRRMIEDAFPDHGVLGEEFAQRPAHSPFTWILDPIDGTRQFISGLPTWGVLIGLAYEGRPILGVIDQPYIGERFRGWSHGGERGADVAMHGGTRPMRVRDCAGLSAARLATTDPALFTAQEGAAFERVRAASQLQRYGGDCYGYAMVALGGLDCVIESGLAPWDAAALLPVLEGAGGSLTDWRGQALDERFFLTPNARAQILAAGDARVRDEAIAMLA